MRWRSCPSALAFGGVLPGAACCLLARLPARCASRLRSGCHVLCRPPTPCSLRYLRLEKSPYMIGSQWGTASSRALARLEKERPDVRLAWRSTNNGLYRRIFHLA